jgi:hypothetical protein
MVISRSANVRRAVRERRRLEAAREFLATFAPEELPTPEEQRDLVELWTRSAHRASPSAKPKAARRRRARAT